MQALPPWVRAHPRGLQLRLRVQPGAKRSTVVGLHADRLKIAIAAPPVDGRANEALIRFLADSLDLRALSVQLTAGATARDKQVLIECDDSQAQRLIARLSALVDGPAY